MNFSALFSEIPAITFRDKLAVSAVEKASTSNEDANLIAKVVSVASDELVNKVVEEVSKNNTSEKQDLSAKVLKAIVEAQPNKIELTLERSPDKENNLDLILP
ncbi:hypothetical protein, partial [Candidatus Pelagibacter communis]|uniref:hypothetical protein n=1 Tax=Pelagibacter ubique TaxID=198252 RepID=UPI001177A477